MTAEREGLAEVISTHRFMARNAAGRMGCRGCTWVGTKTPGTDRAWDEFAAHLADALADLLAARDRRVRAEALREAARAWQVRLNPIAGGYGWLMRRAHRIEGP